MPESHELAYSLCKKVFWFEGDAQGVFNSPRLCRGSARVTSSFYFTARCPYAAAVTE